MVATIEETFEPLPIRRRTLVPIDANQYNITAGPGETKQIKADTAYQAFKLSGFKQAIKIERVSSLTQPLLTREQFTDTNPAAAAGGAPEENEESLLAKYRKSLIVSADELDTLMQKLQEIAARAPVVVPEPVPAATDVAPGATPGLTGMDVHGEGFDEIIPSSPAAKPGAFAKPAEPKEAAKAEPQVAPPAPPVPERELSKEEVDKLLGDKK